MTIPEEPTVVSNAKKAKEKKKKKGKADTTAENTILTEKSKKEKKNRNNTNMDPDQESNLPKKKKKKKKEGHSELNSGETNDSSMTQCPTGLNSAPNVHLSKTTSKKDEVTSLKCVESQDHTSQDELTKKSKKHKKRKKTNKDLDQEDSVPKGKKKKKKEQNEVNNGETNDNSLTPCPTGLNSMPNVDLSLRESKKDKESSLKCVESEDHISPDEIKKKSKKHKRKKTNKDLDQEPKSKKNKKKGQNELNSEETNDRSMTEGPTDVNSVPIIDLSKRKSKKDKESSLKCLESQDHVSQDELTKKSKKHKKKTLKSESVKLNSSNGNHQDDAKKIEKKKTKKGKKDRDMNGTQEQDIASSAIDNGENSSKKSKKSKKKNKDENGHKDEPDKSVQPTPPVGEEKKAKKDPDKKKKKVKKGRGAEKFEISATIKDAECTGMDIKLNKSVSPSIRDPVCIDEIKEKKSKWAVAVSSANHKQNIQEKSKSKKRKSTLDVLQNEQDNVSVMQSESNDVLCPESKRKKKDEGSADHQTGTYSSVSVGQWGTATFNDNKMQNKFLRLLGGFKKGGNETNGIACDKDKNNVEPKGIKFNTALGKSQTESLNQALEDQYNKALDFKLNTQKGIGLGFTPPPDQGKKFYIDTNKSVSKKFD